MTAINDVFALKVFYQPTAGGGELLNVFHYQLFNFGGVPVGSAVSSELAVAFKNNVITEIMDALSSSMQMTRLEIFDYADLTDFIVCVGGCGLPLAGSRIGPSVPPSTAISFRYNRNAVGIRNGAKRFSGLSETDIESSVITVAYKAVVDVLEGALALSIVSTSSTSFVPVVVTGPKVLGINPASYFPIGVDYAGVGTQNSRKVPLNPGTA